MDPTEPRTIAKPRVSPADSMVGREGLEPPTPGLKARRSAR